MKCILNVFALSTNPLAQADDAHLDVSGGDTASRGGDPQVCMGNCASTSSGHATIPLVHACLSCECAPN